MGGTEEDMQTSEVGHGTGDVSSQLDSHGKKERSNPHLISLK